MIYPVIHSGFKGGSCKDTRRMIYPVIHSGFEDEMTDHAHRAYALSFTPVSRTGKIRITVRDGKLCHLFFVAAVLSRP